MSERRFDFWVSDDSGRMIPAMPTGITETELKRRLHIIEKSDFGPESQIQVLLHGEELYSHDFMTEDPPTETREEWISRMPQDMLTRDWFKAMQQWFREEPPR